MPTVQAPQSHGQRFFSEESRAFPGPLAVMKSDPLLQVAVFGAGTFGRNHIRIYRQLETHGVRLAAVVDIDPATAEALRAEGLNVFSSPEACLQAYREGRIQLDAVSICVPTSAHYSVASQALGQGLDVLLEKPIAVNLTEADALVEQAAASGRILQVGLLERFNPAVTVAEALVNGPMFFEAHRLSIFHRRALDVDVVLDLMIHDLDIVLHLTRSPVSRLHAVGLRILSSQVDIANVRVEFASGCVANFTASRVSTETVRKLRFFQPHQYLSIDYARQDLLIINVASGEGGPALALEKPPVTSGEPLLLEIQAFLQSVRTRTRPRVTPRQARDALALALDINREIEAHATRAGLIRTEPH
ncbi:MAG TPA: Gfo/Idh/MocA family oxidoreductase [Acidobacteriaceae bacterium]|nr:Gfo/Idh/MocA family oxidoreductase [Acidobacteriaceae bacterium]